MGVVINGRTPEEIKAAVTCTEKGTIPDCVNCPYYGESDENGFRAYQCHQASFDLVAYAEHLESERDAALAKVPKWISVEERLPEKPGTYGAYSLGIRLVLDFDENEDWWDDEYNHYNGSITHWMPLPEPPEGGK